MQKKPFNILIVDDNQNLAQNMQDIFDEKGYGTAAAVDGRSAIVLCRRREFDLVLVDIQLPDMDGLILQEKLSELMQAEYLIITGHGSVESAVAAVNKRQIVGYETKPVDMDHLLALIHQVSERKQAEGALRESEERFRTLFERSSDAIFLVDARTGQYVTANQAAERLTGFPVSEITTKTIQDLTPEGAEERLNLIASLKTNKEFGEVTYLRADGTERIATLTAVPLSGELIVGIAHDISERKRMEQSLRESEEHYRTLFEHLPIPVFTKNRAGEYTSCNAENQKYWTVSPIGRTDAELLDHDAVAVLREADLHVMETGVPLTVEEHFVNIPLGERHVLSRKVPLRDSTGCVLLAFWVPAWTSPSANGRKRNYKNIVSISKSWSRSAPPRCTRKSKSASGQR